MLAALALTPECGSTLSLLVSDLVHAMRRQREPVSPAALVVVANLAAKVLPSRSVHSHEPDDDFPAGGEPEALGPLFDRLRRQSPQVPGLGPEDPFPPFSELLALLADLLNDVAERLPPDQHPQCAAALKELLRLEVASQQGIAVAAAMLAAVRALVRPFLQSGLVTRAALAQALAGIERRVAADRLAAERDRAATADTEAVNNNEADETDDPDEAADVLYLDNAGLCLLWPFLGHFFTHLKLMGEDRTFLDAARHRAVFPLHHAATGATEAPEYQLALNKVLCGMAPDQLPGFSDPPTAAELEETERLLGALTAHVADLSALSVEELREEFLLRPGALSTRDGAWLLRVERRPTNRARSLPVGLGMDAIALDGRAATGGVVSMAMPWRLNARDLEAELAWFGRGAGRALQAYFGADPAAPECSRPCRPT